VALLVDDVVQLVGDLLVHPAEVGAVEPVLTLLTQLLHQLAQALHALAVAIVHALLHHPPQRRVDVAVVEQVVGQLVEQRVGVEIEALLRAVPAGVRETSCHGGLYPSSTPGVRPGRPSADDRERASDPDVNSR
jgi:hypothetical protein